MRPSAIRTTVLALTIGVGTLATTLPAAAQTVEELVVTGRYGQVPDNVKSLSQPVSYADLDLSTDAGKREFRQRVSLTARFLCDKLGESGASGSPLVGSCRDEAVKDAMNRVGTLESGIAPRGTTWVAPGPWTAPYPADWTTRYPYRP